MHIRTFRAASLQAALEEIRRQMGPEASVLHTRQVRDGWLGWLGRTQVEVTAGLRGDEESEATARSRTDLAEMDVRSAAMDRSGDWSATRRVSAGGFAPASHPSTAGPPELPSTAGPPELMEYESELIRAGVPGNLARRWIEATRSFSAGFGDGGSPTDWFEQLQRTVARDLTFAGPIRTQPGDRRVVALIGPTGVGKTTTIAKLAAGFRIESRRRVGLLTIDTYRIAAVQQLRAYAEIMDLPMEVVEKSDQMRPAMDRLGDVDLILIDTAGRSPRSDARIEQLARFMQEARPDETHLVLSATSSPDAITAVLRGFAPVRPTAAVITKLDEAPHTAGALAQVSAAGPTGGIPLSYVTHGQQVPDDIALADVEGLVARLLPARASRFQLEAA